MQNYNITLNNQLEFLYLHGVQVRVFNVSEIRSLFVCSTWIPLLSPPFRLQCNQAIGLKEGSFHCLPFL
jgi:hypothetical protein